MAKAFNSISAFERWARRVTGVIFLLVGVYFCLAFIFKVVADQHRMTAGQRTPIQRLDLQ